MTYTPEERAQIAAAMTAILATDDTTPLTEILKRAKEEINHGAIIAREKMTE